MRTGEQAIGEQATDEQVRVEQVTGEPEQCEFCGSRHDLRLTNNHRICEQCWRAAKDLFRIGPCCVCGQVLMCWEVVGGKLACLEHCDQVVVLQKYGRCECGRLAHLQKADRIGRRYLCVHCQNDEECSS